ncbi:MAG: serine/threonine-protein kinase, partial [Anaerolineales bacterium]
MTLENNSLLHNRYRILDKLGCGGMGAVYRGRDERLGVDVAIKENLFISPEAERQFKREATLLALLRHPNLPRVTDHFIIPEEGQYLVMDHIPGDDARQLLERQGGPLPEADVLRWMGEILEAVNHLHTQPQPIIHRDIKPGNIKITPEGQAVLVDFGLAKVYDTRRSTTIGARAFTPGFAPPEQYGQGRTDVRTDIYSLGATFYNLLTNILPADSLGRAMGQQRLVPILELNPSISPHVVDAIERATAIKPGDRFATVQGFSDALAPEPEQAIDDVLVDYVPPTERARPTVRSGSAQPGTAVPTKRKRNLRFITIVSGVVVAVAFGAWGLLTVAGVFDGSEPTITLVPTTEEVVALAPTETAT